MAAPRKEKERDVRAKRTAIIFARTIILLATTTATLLVLKKIECLIKTVTAMCKTISAPKLINTVMITTHNASVPGPLPVDLTTPTMAPDKEGADGDNNVGNSRCTHSIAEQSPTPIAFRKERTKLCNFGLDIKHLCLSVKIEELFDEL